MPNFALQPDARSARAAEFVALGLGAVVRNTSMLSSLSYPKALEVVLLGGLAVAILDIVNATTF